MRSPALAPGRRVRHRVLWDRSDQVLAQTVHAMRRMVDTYAVNPWTRRLVGQIFTRAGVDPRDHLGQLDAIHDYVRGVRYVRDPDGLELLNEPRWTLAAAVGDCDDLATLEGALLAAAGFPVRFGLSAKHDTATPDHVYCLVEVDGETLIVDATRDGPPGDHAPAARRWEERRTRW